MLSDRYLLSERIATGGMGAVWRCTDTLLGREVAVKVLLPSLVADPEFTTRFHGEARMMAALRHPGIVQVHDFGSATLADGSQVSYLVMEYVDGEPLLTWIRRAGHLDPASTMSVVAQAAQALHAAHGAGIVHRDVKPGNLLVKRDGRVVLVDFGIARSATMAGITAANMVLGTASYMSPEQAAGQPVSPATDVYALGAVAYYCLAGRPPFDGENPLQVALRHVQDEPAPLPPGTPPAVIEVVRRALAKSPADRFPGAAAMAEAAQDARDATLASVPVPPRPPWAVPGPAVAGPAALPTPEAPAAPNAAGPPPATPSGGASADAPAPHGRPPASVGPDGTPTPPRPVTVAPAWSAGVAQPGAAAPRPGGYGPQQDHPGMPNPLEEPTSGRPGRGRTLALAGAAGIVLVALLTTVAVAALRSPAGSDSRERRAALTGESAAAPPAPPEPQVSGNTPEPGSSTGRATKSPPAAPTRSTGHPAAPTTAGSTAQPTTGTTGAPTPSSTTSAPEKANPYTAGQVCGSGYQVIDSATLTAGGTRQGRVYLLYNPGNGYNCVVTLKDTGVGTATTVAAYLEVQGRTRSTDSGAFKYYAGPVRAGAAGACVKWGGSAGGASYGSPFEHCG
ncbi:serine/threonine protein kinase [Micromonospora rhizosphaerae]|uniref:non-specific serine/threonine protein kinase n=1 Tax=Micromonospora rhizosphaerae TaxID=568872 RepID=A0A1C6T8E5_9ACTN|nr:serine/threonine protein kinase [Micromonospora rhizosphaerae]